MLIIRNRQQIEHLSVTVRSKNEFNMNLCFFHGTNQITCRGEPIATNSNWMEWNSHGAMVNWCGSGGIKWNFIDWFLSVFIDAADVHIFLCLVDQRMGWPLHSFCLSNRSIRFLFISICVLCMCECNIILGPVSVGNGQGVAWCMCVCVCAAHRRWIKKCIIGTLRALL